VCLYNNLTIILAVDWRSRHIWHKIASSRSCPYLSMYAVCTIQYSMYIKGKGKLRVLVIALLTTRPAALLQSQEVAADWHELMIPWRNAIHCPRWRTIGPAGPRCSTHIARVRTILALGYWVLPNIFQYWVLGNTVIGCHTQYQYCLETLIPVASRWQQGNWGGGKVKLVSWQIKKLKKKYNEQWY